MARYPIEITACLFPIRRKCEHLDAFSLQIGSHGPSHGHSGGRIAMHAYGISVQRHHGAVNRFDFMPCGHTQHTRGHHCRIGNHRSRQPA